MVYKSRQYLDFRRTMTDRCPHCHHQLETGLGHEPFSGPIRIESVHSAPPRPQRDSFPANSVGEEEGDSLIMKP